jgi:hypothetical protein
MKTIIGILLIALGIGLGIYFGIFVLFIGGILEFAKSIMPLNIMGLAWGIIKVILSGLVGWGSFAICTLIGSFLIADN